MSAIYPDLFSAYRPLIGRDWLRKLPDEERKVFSYLGRSHANHGHDGGVARAATAARDHRGRFARECTPNNIQNVARSNMDYTPVTQNRKVQTIKPTLHCPLCGGSGEADDIVPDDSPNKWLEGVCSCVVKQITDGVETINLDLTDYLADMYNNEWAE